jgi:C-terminal processing protease CtpA/Prc
MNFLANCDALIIDLRENGGGSGTLIQLLLSYFFDEPVHYNNMYFRKKDFTEQNWTSAYVVGPKMTEVDLYVLTSSRTFSAAEEFTYDLKNLERATIVGETTGGGAHPVEMHYLRALNVELKVPFGRSFNPKTGIDWEVKGIEPHIKIEKNKAFDKAYTRALKNLYLHAKGDEREKRKWHWEYRHALDNPLLVDIEILKSYVGQYGPLRIILENKNLYLFEPDDSEPKKLCALSKTLFVIDGNDQIRGEFETDENGEVVAIQGITTDGSKSGFPKSK